MTRDSGIDSDNPLQLVSKKTGELLLGKRQIDQTKNEITKIIQNENISSSTRDNSMDHDHDQDSELDEQEDIFEDSFDFTSTARQARRSFDGAASSRRQIFKNSCNKHNTIDVSSILRRPSHINLKKTNEDNLDLIQENYKKHLEHIGSSKPVFIKHLSL